MALDVKISFSWTDYCRLCLMDGDIMLPLFDEEGIHRQLGRKIEECLQLLTYDGDPLPRRICHKCLYKLNQAFDFRAMAVESFERLKVHLLPLKHVASVREYLERTEEIKGFKDVKQKFPVQPGAIGAIPNVESSTTPSITSPSLSKPRIRIKSDAELKGAQPSVQMPPCFRNLVQMQPLPPQQLTGVGLKLSAPPSPFQSPQENSVPQSTRSSSHLSPGINLVNSVASHFVSSEMLLRPFQINSPPRLSPHVSSQTRVEDSDLSRLVNLEANKESDETFKHKQMEQGSDCDLRTTNTVLTLPKKKRRKQLAGPASRKAVTFPTAWQCLLCSSYFLSRKSLSLHMEECLKCNTCYREFSSLNEKAVHEANKHLRVIVDAEKKHMPKRCNRCPSRFASNIMLSMHVKYDHISSPTHTDAGGPSSDNQQVVTESEAFKAVANYSGNTSPVLPANSPSELSSEDSDVIDDCGNGFPDKVNAAQMLDPSLLVPKTPKGDFFPCIKCSRKFTTKPSMLHHLQSHDKLSYKCSDCPSVFPTGSKLRCHEKDQHGKSTPIYFRCKVCDKMFLSRSLLIQHKQTHKSLVIHDGINSNPLLSKKIVTGPKAKEKLLCHRCSEQFDDDDAFMWHLYQHAKTPENPKAKGGDSTGNKEMGSTAQKLSVNADKGQFRSSSIETSSEERIIKCDLCSTVCRSKEYYTLHMARHMGKTKSHFPCIGCDQVFKNIEALNRHTCFGGEAKEKESCLDCGQALQTGEDHTCDNKCRLCGKVFRSSRGQRLHALYKHGLGLSPEDDVAVPYEGELPKQKEPSGDLVDPTKDGSVSKADVLYSAPSDKQYQQSDRCSLERPSPEGAPGDVAPILPTHQEVSTLTSSRPTVLFRNISQESHRKEKNVLDSGKPTFRPLVFPALASSSSIVNTNSLLESSPLNSH